MSDSANERVPLRTEPTDYRDRVATGSPPTGPSWAIVRSLERERNEALREAKEMTDEWRDAFDGLRRVLLERDEVAEDRDRWKARAEQAEAELALMYAEDPTDAEEPA